MKILLCQDVEKLGWVGDIVEVSTGYARNCLLPLGLGKTPTDANIKAVAQAKAKRAEQLRQEAARTEKLAEAIDGAEIIITAKANELGHLFGSVGADKIAANLREQGFEVPDEVVNMTDHIKDVGTHQVKLAFKRPTKEGYVADLTATVKCVVIAEDSAIESKDKDSQG